MAYSYNSPMTGWKALWIAFIAGIFSIVIITSGLWLWADQQKDGFAHALAEGLKLTLLPLPDVAATQDEQDQAQSNEQRSEDVRLCNEAMKANMDQNTEQSAEDFRWACGKAHMYYQ